jgi:ribonuclease-3
VIRLLLAVLGTAVFLFLVYYIGKRFGVVSDDRNDRLEQQLGYVFRDAGLLRTALTHRSHGRESDRLRADNYERLEFLGDALLGFLVAEWLFDDDEESAEGILTRRRASVVRPTSLARASRRLGLGQEIRHGRGVDLSAGQLKPGLHADLFEAVLAAIFLDGGIESARAFVLRHLEPELSRASLQTGAVDDYKTKLQEMFQARLRRTPRYRIVSTSGPAHAMEFEVEVWMDDKLLARGSGKTRKQAEQVAARSALEQLEDS